MMWRNVHTPVSSELDRMLRDARVFKGHVFKMVYGSEIIRYFAPDNSIRLYSVFKIPEPSPYVKSTVEHRASPRKNDKVLLIDGDAEMHGHIVWTSSSDDAVGVYIYQKKCMESFSLGDLESNLTGRIRWRVVT